MGQNLFHKTAGGLWGQCANVRKKMQILKGFLCTERMVELCAALRMFGNHYAFAHFLHVSGTSKKGRGGGIFRLAILGQLQYI